MGLQLMPDMSTAMQLKVSCRGISIYAKMKCFMLILVDVYMNIKDLVISYGHPYNCRLQKAYT